MAPAADDPRTEPQVQANPTILACAVENGQTKADSSVLESLDLTRQRVPEGTSHIGIVHSRFSRLDRISAVVLCENAADSRRAFIDMASAKRFFAVLVCALLFSAATSAKASHKFKPSHAPDKAYLQRIWDGWEQLDASKQAQFYAKGSHTFFDIAPLKYTSWVEYERGVTKELAVYKSARFTVGSDAEIHSCGADCAWSAATVKQDAIMKSGQHDLVTFRWTAIFQRQNGKWVMVHEHVSTPAP
jgi:ketosteroid isomerase-like protein